MKLKKKKKKIVSFFFLALFQAMAAQAQRAATAAAMQRQATTNVNTTMAATAMNVGTVKNRGRPQTITKVMPTANNNIRAAQQQQALRPQIPGGVVLPNNFQMSNPGQYIQVNKYVYAIRPWHNTEIETFYLQIIFISNRTRLLQSIYSINQIISFKLKRAYIIINCETIYLHIVLSNHFVGNHFSSQKPHFDG